MKNPACKEQLIRYFAAHKDEMIEDVCALVKIPSVREAEVEGKPYGEAPAAALTAAMVLFEKYGFAGKNYDNYVVTADFNKEEKVLDILAHLDVVPVGDGWTVTEPFTPKLVGNRLYGRGTADDKGPAVAALYAMRAVKELGIPLQKNMRLILGSDEECGSSDIKHYYAIEKEAPMTFSPDASFPLINLEKGGLRGAYGASYAENTALPRVLTMDGGTKLNVVPDKVEALLEGISLADAATCCAKAETATGVSFQAVEEKGLVRIYAKGVSAHASMPEKGNNGITAMLQLLSGMSFAASDGFDKIKAMAKIFPHGDWAGTAAGIAMSDPEAGALTNSLDIFHYTVTGFTAETDCRASLAANDENLRDVLMKITSENGITMEPCSVFPAHHVPADTAFVRTLLDCYEMYTGEPGKCLAIGGGTYVHYLENGVAFGCEFEGEDNHLHGDDEFVNIDNLLLSAQIFAQAIVEICG